MAVKFFALNGVPDDEAEEVRALLNEHEISYYETPGGNWGVSMPALWLNDKSQLAEAKALIAQYQLERAKRMRQTYQQQQLDHGTETLWDRLILDPVRSIALLAIVIAVLYFSIKPFLIIGK